ncbi:hypothetical protein DICPUDRAFT_84879 [Dictyostelium purpureum]|uniref:CCHC-type domain-containing protein n=1 Tax=Dictyostelium purpureum TaxID=5786 RepID=F1A409_DICPU|nr:uncharacterized protein DICPUDRAFT_84879 [Dictyostelium purpureum]EGC29070.1 hypothetical protein DICPUDRAFT_84879 [Dictyostelium purpureum]|eukprot:XP_003294402.1 hypothetical protein DICPUDRAFT_84879 [Dictyostelium purpureum]
MSKNTTISNNNSKDVNPINKSSSQLLKNNYSESSSSSSSSSSNKTTTTNNLSNISPPIKKEDDPSLEFNNFSNDAQNLNTGRRSVEGDEFREYLLKELSILRLENERFRSQNYGFERRKKPLSEDVKFEGGFSMGFEKTWDLFEFQFRYHFGPRFDNTDLISSLKSDALIYLQRMDPNGNNSAEENLLQLRKQYQDLPTTLLLKFSEFTRTGKFESLERLLLVFDTVRSRVKLSDDAAMVTLKSALGINFSKALMVDVSDIEGYSSFQKFSEKIVRLEKNYQLTMGKSLYLRQDEIQGIFGASVSSSGLTSVVSNTVAAVEVKRNSEFRCFICGNPGHLARECREKYNSDSDRRNNNPPRYNNYNQQRYNGNNNQQRYNGNNNNQQRYHNNNQLEYNSNQLEYSNNRFENNFNKFNEDSRFGNNNNNNRSNNNDYKSNHKNNNIQSQPTKNNNNSNNFQSSSTHNNNNSNRDNQQSPLGHNKDNGSHNNSNNNNNNIKVEDSVKFNKYSIQLLEKIVFGPEPPLKGIGILPGIDVKVAPDSSIILTPQEQAKFDQLIKYYSEIKLESLRKAGQAEGISHSIPLIDGTDKSKPHQEPYPVSQVQKAVMDVKVPATQNSSIPDKIKKPIVGPYRITAKTNDNNLTANMESVHHPNFNVGSPQLFSRDNTIENFWISKSQRWKPKLKAQKILIMAFIGKLLSIALLKFLFENYMI